MGNEKATAVDHVLAGIHAGIIGVDASGEEAVTALLLYAASLLYEGRVSLGQALRTAEETIREGYARNRALDGGGSHGSGPATA